MTAQQQTDLRRAHAASIAAQAKAKRESAAAATATATAKGHAMTAAHTPGPWVIQQRASSGLFLVTADGAEVAGVIGLKNALLVSTAPELLKALIYLRDCAESGAWPSGERWTKVQSAIKKATGDTP